MKSVVFSEYGGPEVLRVKEVNVPFPNGGEVLVKNRASSVTMADTFLRRGEPKIGRLFLGLMKPKNEKVGTGFSGVVAEVGNGVKGFKVGDKVYGETKLGFGANAEYVCVDVKNNLLQHLPDNVSFEAGASLCDGALTSYNFLVDMAKIKEGQHILINGASGALGQSAIELAKSFGARVTAVCSFRNIDLVKRLGADEVIDYTTHDFTQNKGCYDLIYDAVGKSTFGSAKRALKQGGAYLSPVLSFGLLLALLRTSMFGDKKAMFEATGMRKVHELNVFLKEINVLLGRGLLNPVIDRRYSIDDICKAHGYVDSERKKGNVVLYFDED